MHAWVCSQEELNAVKVSHRSPEGVSGKHAGASNEFGVLGCQLIALGLKRSARHFSSQLADTVAFYTMKVMRTSFDFMTGYVLFNFAVAFHAWLSKQAHHTQESSLSFFFSGYYPA